MIVDNALAYLETLWASRGGDTGRRGVEHKNFWLLWFTYNKCAK
jgi:hypothetical protein